MSRVYFHTPSNTAEILGAERAFAACIVESLGAALLCSYVEALGFSTLYREPGLLRVAMGDGRTALRVAGQNLDGWQVLLNTAIAAGSDPVRFLARMHAQCEIHGWIAGEDRAWLADIIRTGLKDGVMRETLRERSIGWPGIIELLEANSTEPVVMSYSVCDRFPSMTAWDPGVDDDGYPLPEVEAAWEAMTVAERFAACMPSESTLRITPSNLRTQGFGHGMSAFDVLRLLTDSETPQ
jgi:hypothetical protein